MTAGRLSGDKVVERLGGVRVIVVGGALAAAGLAVATLAPWWPVALLGFALVGAGCSNIVPVFYSAIGRQRAMPQAAAVSAVTLLGYAGILAGPACIGLLAASTSLPSALWMVAALLVVVSASGPALRAFVPGATSRPTP